MTGPAMSRPNLTAGSRNGNLLPALVPSFSRIRATTAADGLLYGAAAVLCAGGGAPSPAPPCPAREPIPIGVGDVWVIARRSVPEIRPGPRPGVAGVGVPSLCGAYETFAFACFS